MQEEDYENALEKIEEIARNAGRQETKKGKSHMEELIKKNLTDDEQDAIDNKNYDYISEFLDEFYEEKGWNSEGEEKEDEDDEDE